MVSTWQNSFAQLLGFIKDNPSIEISENCISIPGDVRPEFYRLFDVVRTDFLKDNFPSSLEKGYELSKEFASVYGDAIAASGLEAISVRAAVNWFLQDPVNGLMRSLFDPIFNLIRGRLTEQTFAESSTQLVDDAFSDYFHEGYERWALLGLMTHLQPDKNYYVDSRDYHADSEVSEGSTSPGLREESVDLAVESKKIAFNVTSLSTFIVPRVLLHTQRLGCNVAIHTDFTEAYWRARTKSEKMEWLSIKGLVEEFGRSRLWPDLLMYTAAKTEDLNLIADYYWVARPDIIVEVEETDGWYERGGLDLARRHVAALKPRLGCYIICRTDAPAEAYAELASASSAATQNGDDQGSIQEPEPSSDSESSIHIIHAGYDTGALERIVERLQQEKPA